MNSEKKLVNPKFTAYLQNLYYAGTLISLFFIMAQVFYAKRTMKESSEWEKAKLTIDNVERFKENLTHTKLYGSDAFLVLADSRVWPDFTTPDGQKVADTLRIVYFSQFSSQLEARDDFEKSLSILDAFAYPIIMGYASEMGSFQSVAKEYYALGSFMELKSHSIR